jgi:hypothetical protein
MARKATRGRKEPKRRSRRPAPRTPRTRRTAAHASKAEVRTGKQAAAARRGTAPVAREPKARDKDAEQDRMVRTEEDEELDWLSEDEDPRSQIVEDDDPDPGREEEW